MCVVLWSPGCRALVPWLQTSRPLPRVVAGSSDDGARVTVAPSRQHGRSRQPRGGEDVLGLPLRRWNNREVTLKRLAG